VTILNSKKLNEGLKTNDLENLVYPVFEIDTFKSKMGDDTDVCVLTFQVVDRYPARDMMEFIEKGFDFVLDADISAGENKKGEYSVFVEIQRTPNLAEQIQDVLYGVKNLTGIDEFQFKYYKQEQSHSANTESLSSIPSSEQEYLSMLKEYQIATTKDFFNKTVMDDIELTGNNLTILKPFGNRLTFEIVENGTLDQVKSKITDSLVETSESTAETFWLTKVLGDYEIVKYGENFLFQNNNRAMLLKRRS